MRTSNERPRFHDLNAKAAARTAQRLIDDGMAAGAFRQVHAMSAAGVISSVMVRIQRRQVASATGLQRRGGVTGPRGPAAAWPDALTTHRVRRRGVRPPPPS